MHVIHHVVVHIKSEERQLHDIADDRGLSVNCSIGRHKLSRRLDEVHVAHFVLNVLQREVTLKVHFPLIVFEPENGTGGLLALSQHQEVVGGLC